MYFIMLLCFIISVVAACGFTMGTFFAIINAPTFIMMFLLIVPMFVASGLSKEVPKIFKLLGNSKLSYERSEYRKMLEAISLLIKLNFCAGAFTTIVGFISLLHSLTDIATLGPNVAVIAISIFYMIFLCLMLFPAQAKIKTKLIETE
ncbi:MAG: hypothetical protein ACERKN_17230 [Velocimicrobium sp.]